MRLGGFHTGPPAALARWLGQPRSLTDGPIIPALVVFAMPLLATNFMHSIAGTWAAIWVAHELGPGALIAVVNTNVFLFMMMGVLIGVGAASGIAIAQSVGGGKPEDAKQVAGTSLTFAFLAGLVAAIGAVVAAPLLVDLIGIPPAARNYAIVYFRATSLGLPFLFTFIFLMMMVRGTGDSRTPFIYSLVWIGTSLVFGPVLLTGYSIFPEVGIAGIAVASISGNFIALVAMLANLRKRKHVIAFHAPEIGYLRPQGAILRMLITRGLPMGAETIVVQGAYFVLLVMVNYHGTVVAAAYSAAAQLWGYVQMPAMALAASISAMAAQNIGAGRWGRIDLLAVRGCAVSMAITAIAALVLLALGDAPLRLFLPEADQSLEIARQINLIVLWSWSVLAITAGLFAIVRANGAMLPPTLIFAVTMWGFRVPFAWALQPLMGEAAIWWSFPLGTITSAFFSWAYYRYGGWRKRALLMEQVDTAKVAATCLEK